MAETKSLRLAETELLPHFCCRYTELVVQTWLAPLRTLAELFTMQVCCRVPSLVAQLLCDCNPLLARGAAVRYARAWQLHLNDGVDLERLDALMPKALGVTWAAALGSPNLPLYQACTYARQLESVAARWQNGDYGMLQPVVAFPVWVVVMIQTEVKKEAGRKELELLGQSSAARTAVGGSSVWQSRGEQAT
jgi:hypothetical protein